MNLLFKDLHISSTSNLKHTKLYNFDNYFGTTWSINQQAAPTSIWVVRVIMECRDAQRMMTSPNGNIFRLTGHLCGEFTGHRWIPCKKASDAKLCCFLWSAAWINGWVNNREAGDLRRHQAHIDVIVMGQVSGERQTMLGRCFPGLHFINLLPPYGPLTRYVTHVPWCMPGSLTGR